MSVNLAWVSDIKDPKKKKEFEDYLRNASLITDKLLKILDDQERSLESIENNIEQFDSPSWSSRQAWINGRKAQIRVIRSLFNYRMTNA